MNTGIKLNWAQRLSPVIRIGVAILLSLVLVMMAGIISAFMVSMFEHDGDPHKPRVYAVLAAIIGTAALIVWALTIIVRSWRALEVSRYDRRYHRMWAILGGCGALAGLGAGLASGRPSDGGFSIFSNSAMEPGWAIALAAGTTILFALAAVVYHRTVDDHEERAYLWGSAIAYYFILTAFPVAWLLARGGLIEKLGIGSAIVILGMSIVVQTAVWLRFKFR